MMFLIIGVIVLLLLMVAFFSGIETGLISLDRFKLENEANDNPLKKQILNIIQKPDKLLGTTLLGTNIGGVIITTIATTYFVENRGFFTETTLSLILAVIVLIFTAIITKVLYNDFGETLVPKTFNLFKFFASVFAFPIFLVTIYYRFLNKFLKLENDDSLTREDLNYFLTNSKQTNSLSKFQSKMVAEALDFAKLKAKKVMIPRTEIVGISTDASYEEFIELSTMTGFTRFPVYEENMDNIKGVMILYDILNCDNKTTFKITDYILDATFYHESMEINALLKDMQANCKSMAIILDSFGGTAGLITIEDILEEIVGEITDEYDSTDAPSDPEIHKISNINFVIKGFVEIAILNSEYDFGLPEGNYETVAGLIINKVAHIPKIKSKFDIGNWEIEILESNAKKIKKLKFMKKKIR